MSEPGPERRKREPPWGEKIVRLHDSLTAQGIPYAFGGAIALNYHREPRSTLDIDINVFLPPDSDEIVLTLLRGLDPSIDTTTVQQEIRETGQARALWGSTFVDLFFANTDLHTSMAQRVAREPFADGEINVLSIEDLLICKALFDRPKDWLDIDAVAQTRRDALDRAYITTWLTQFVADDDHRLDRLRQILDRPT